MATKAVHIEYFYKEPSGQTYKAVLGDFDGFYAIPRISERVIVHLVGYNQSSDWLVHEVIYSPEVDPMTVLIRLVPTIGD